MRPPVGISVLNLWHHYHVLKLRQGIFNLFKISASYWFRNLMQTDWKLVAGCTACQSIRDENERLDIFWPFAIFHDTFFICYPSYSLSSIWPQPYLAKESSTQIMLYALYYQIHLAKVSFYLQMFMMSSSWMGLLFLCP